MMILAKCLSVVTQLLLHLLQRKKPLKSLKKKLTMAEAGSEAASQTPETDSEESDPASEEV